MATPRGGVHSSRSLMAMILFFWAFAGATGAIAQNGARALVLSVAGNEVTYSAEPGGAYFALAEGMQLKEGASIKTGDASTVSLIFSNGSSLTVTPNTSIELTDLRQEPFDAGALGSFGQLEKDPSQSATRIRMDAGEVLGEVRGLAADSVFEINTQVGTAGIRGTVYRVKLEMDGTRIRLTVSNAHGDVIASSASLGVTANDLQDGTETVIEVDVDTDTGEIKLVDVSDGAIPAGELQLMVEIVEKVISRAKRTSGQGGQGSSAGGNEETGEGVDPDDKETLGDQLDDRSDSSGGGDDSSTTASSELRQIAQATGKVVESVKMAKQILPVVLIAQEKGYTEAEIVKLVVILIEDPSLADVVVEAVEEDQKGKIDDILNPVTEVNPYQALIDELGDGQKMTFSGLSSEMKKILFGLFNTGESRVGGLLDLYVADPVLFAELVGLDVDGATLDQLLGHSGNLEVLEGLVDLVTQSVANGNGELFDILYDIAQVNGQGMINQDLVYAGLLVDSLATDVTITDPTLDEGRIWTRQRLIAGHYNDTVIEIAGKLTDNETIASNIIEFIEQTSPDGKGASIESLSGINSDILGTKSIDIGDGFGLTTDDFSAFIGKNITIDSATVDLTDHLGSSAITGEGKVLAVGAFEDLTIAQSVAFENAEPNANNAFALIAGHKLTVMEGADISYDGGHLGINARDTIVMNDMSLIVSNGSLEMGTLNDMMLTNVDIDANGEFIAYADNQIELDDVRFGSNVSEITLAAKTLSISNVDFGVATELYSENGLLNFGDTQTGYINFVENVTSLDRPLNNQEEFDANGELIDLKPLSELK